MAQEKTAVKPYRYFDTPDGEDTEKKLLFIMRRAVPVSLCTALGDVVSVLFQRSGGS